MIISGSISDSSDSSRLLDAMEEYPDVSVDLACRRVDVLSRGGTCDKDCACLGSGYERRTIPDEG